MNLTEYKETYLDILASELSQEEKECALDLLASEIESCVWSFVAKSRAKLMVEEIRNMQNQFPNGGLDALDSLAKKGMLVLKNV